MLLNLMLELTEIGERGKGVVICLPQKLHAACPGQFTETVQHLRGVSLELLQSGAGDRECHLEVASVLFDEVQQKVVHRNIASLGYPAEDGSASEIVIVVGILADVEESVLPQPRRLMNLKIQTDVLFHNIPLFIINN